MAKPASPAEAVLVTGVSFGIGRAVAERLARDGNRVVGVDVVERPPECLAEFALLDLADIDAARPALARLAERHAFTRLVNNVGSSRRSFCARELVRFSDGSTA